MMHKRILVAALVVNAVSASITTANVLLGHTNIAAITGTLIGVSLSFAAFAAYIVRADQED